MLPKFIWDPAKARSNWRKHGVTFEEAVEAFDDPACIEEADSDLLYNEPRYRRLCMLGNCILVVVYTERGEVTRIISARKATSHEQKTYLEQTSF